MKQKQDEVFNLASLLTSQFQEQNVIVSPNIKLPTQKNDSEEEEDDSNLFHKQPLKRQQTNKTLANQNQQDSMLGINKKQIAHSSTRKMP